MAAKVALVLVMVVISLAYFVPGIEHALKDINGLHFLAMLFTSLIIILLIIGKVCPRKEAWVQKEAKVIDMTPWKFTRPLASVLVIVVLSIYAALADFSERRFGGSGKWLGPDRGPGLNFDRAGRANSCESIGGFSCAARPGEARLGPWSSRRS